MRGILYIFLLLAPIFIIGQNTDKYTAVDLVYQKEFTAGVKLLSNGFGAELNFKRTPNIRYKTVRQFEILELKDPSEYRQTNISSIGATPRSYIYGKEHNFYVLSFSYGQDRVITQKGRKNGVSLFWAWKVGPSLGLLKPYYLCLPSGDGNCVDQRYSEENETAFLDNARIAGGSGFAFGWGEVKIKPGVTAKVSTSADWASKRDYIKSAEVGLQVNVFAGEVPIMLIKENDFWFANLYIGVLFGRRR